MIDPDLITTVRVGELPSEVVSLTDFVPHEVGDELKKATVQALADTIGTYLGSLGGLAFNPTTVLDGQTLPATTSNEWILVGKGTFYNVGGGSTIVTTEELNALTSNGTFWSLSVEIPINVELAGITQNIRSGYTQTVPSEDAVYKEFQKYIKTSDLPPLYNPTKIEYIADGSNLSFNLPSLSIISAVFWNGALLRDSDWTQTDDILTILFTLSSGDIIKPI